MKKQAKIFETFVVVTLYQIWCTKTQKENHPIWVVFFLCCELCSRLRPTGSRSTTAKRSRWEIQRRLLWRSGQNLSALQAAINFGHRKSASRGVASVRHYKSFCLKPYKYRLFSICWCFYFVNRRCFCIRFSIQKCLIVWTVQSINSRWRQSVLQMRRYIASGVLYQRPHTRCQFSAYASLVPLHLWDLCRGLGQMAGRLCQKAQQKSR